MYQYFAKSRIETFVCPKRGLSGKLNHHFKINYKRINVKEKKKKQNEQLFSIGIHCFQFFLSWENLRDCKFM